MQFGVVAWSKVRLQNSRRNGILGEENSVVLGPKRRLPRERGVEKTHPISAEFSQFYPEADSEGGK